MGLLAISQRSLVTEIKRWVEAEKQRRDEWKTKPLQERQITARGLVETTKRGSSQQPGTIPVRFICGSPGSDRSHTSPGQPHSSRGGGRARCRFLYTGQR